MKGQSDRSTHLDGLRGLAALVVVFSHTLVAFDFALITKRTAESHGSWDLGLAHYPFWMLPFAGDLAVPVFFVLSGYVLGKSFAKTSLGAGALVIKRYVRLTPPILAACLVSFMLLAAGLMRNHDAAVLTRSSWLAVQFQQTPSIAGALREGLYHTLLHDVPLGTSYDSSLWTMRVEFIGSLMLIAIFAIMELAGRGDRQRRNRAAAWGFAAVTVLLCGFYFSLFAIGAAYHLFDVRRRLFPTGLGIAAAVTILLGAWFLGTADLSEGGLPIYRPLALAIEHVPQGPLRSIAMGMGMNSTEICRGAAAILLVLLADAWEPARRFLSGRWPAYLGKISFPLYLIHVPLICSLAAATLLLLHRAHWPLAPAIGVSALILWGASLAAAALMTVVVEEPAILAASAAGRLADTAFGARPRSSRRAVRLWRP